VLAILGGSTESHVHETSYVDPVAKRVTMVSTNLTWSNILNVCETVVYRPDDADSTPGHERTQFNQVARITAVCGGWQRIRSKIEEVAIGRFGENARKGREGFEAVLEMSRKVFGEERERRKMPQRA
jgi:hypothetical protein